MSDAFISILVERIIADAREKCGPVLTTESFLLSLIKFLSKHSDDDDIGPELASARRVFDEAFFDSHIIANEILKEMIRCGCRLPGESESAARMELALMFAGDEADEEGDCQVTADRVLRRIIQAPGDTLKEYLRRAYVGDVYLDIEDMFVGEEDEDEEMTDNEEDSFTVTIIEEPPMEDPDACAQEIWNTIIGALKNESEQSPEENAPVDECAASEADDDVEPEAEGTGQAAAKSEIADLVRRVKGIRRHLQEKVFGQDNAINTFVTGFYQACMLALLDEERRQPAATFLFAGPPGVGKTYLAEMAAKLLDLPFMRFDMSEYADKEANIEFCGSDQVYKNAKPGNVTHFVEKNPQCVLLFDEVEKAHSCVIHLFLQMLDAGRLRDNHTDQEVSFRDAIIIFTTNAGKQLYDEHENGDFSLLPRKVILRALEKDANPETGVPYFPAAMCSRFASGNVVMFNHVTAHHLSRIAKEELARQADLFEKKTGIKISIGDKVSTALLFAEGGAADARTVRARAIKFFNDELYELLRMVSSDKAQTEIEHLETIRISVDLSRADEKVLSLYENNECTRVLVFASEETVAECAGKLPGCCVLGAQTVEDAIELMKNHRLDLALVDVRFGVKDDSAKELNIEDVESEARNFMRFIREMQSGLALYIIEHESARLANEEKLSFTRQGVRGTLRLSGGDSDIAGDIQRVSAALYQQRSMSALARENKTVSFETAQTVSATGKEASITLFDFKLRVAVDSEDAHSVLSAISKPDVRFEDVIGAEEAKKELSYFVEYLKNPRKYMGTGVKAPKGVLLYGPPGTGKTMLAKAMACESDVTFIAAEGNQFLKKLVGEGSEHVHELFRTARKYAPTVLFVDEIDAIAKERHGSSMLNSGGEETLTAFLTEMDGFSRDTSKPVFVLAATNFDIEPGGAKSLDPALMRRFDRRVYIDLPNRADRCRFLNFKISQNAALKLTETKIENIALRSTGMSLADLDSVVELALRSAIRDGSTVVTDEIFEEAFETFTSGEEKKWDVSLLERVARHEAGHAFLCWHSGQTPSYLTIVARGSHGGYMQHSEQEGKLLFTREELLSRIRVSLGGRAAEIVYYGEQDGLSTGAGADLVSATSTARNIICSYGMDEDFGLAVVDRVSTADGMTDDVRAAVNRILDLQMREAVKIISENRAKIDALVSELMDRNHMSGPEINRVLSEA